MSEKLTKKELKQPDAFQKAGTEASTWAVQHGRNVVIAVIAVFVIGLVAGLAHYFGDRSRGHAAKELGGALAILNRPVEGQPAGEVSSGEPFKSAKEKDEALSKALSEFRAENPAGASAATAALTQGQALLRQGKPDEALAAYGDYLKQASPDDPLRAAGLEGKGYALEAKGQLDEALAAFDQMAKENRADFLKGMGLYHRARILILQGKKEEAAKQLSEIPAAAPSSAAARLATDRMGLLASEGIKVPPPSAPSAADAG